MNILVTGGCGFLGAYIAKNLVARGHDVVIADGFPHEDNLQVAWDSGPPSGFVMERVDIRDTLALLRLCWQHDIDTIVHLAYAFTDVSADNPQLAVDVNVSATTRLFELAHTLELRRVVWASSSSVFMGYRGTDHVVDDDTLPNPASVYGYCKLFNEHMAHHYDRYFGLDSIGLRLPLLNGIGKPTGITAPIIRNLVVNPALGRPGVVPCPNDVPRWLFIEDAAAAFCAAVEHPERTDSRVFNVPGIRASMREAMDAVKSILPEVEVFPGDGSIWGEGRPFSPNFGRGLEEELGYTPKTPLREQISSMIDRVRAHRDVVERLFT